MCTITKCMLHKCMLHNPAILKQNFDTKCWCGGTPVPANHDASHIYVSDRHRAAACQLYCNIWAMVSALHTAFDPIVAL